ncbi:hypothetical protein Cpir12675_004885 [Ceratocystis pirilliformis]|uniref:Adenosine deaminase domain-containing protein n=1 Tax=Ceratocystis pirilliformis TaxID=259994 RepID=A0ABR3YWH0_9PEZI
MVVHIDPIMDFRALPKIELHAHLSGSISRRCLHGIWASKKAAKLTTLPDPVEAMPEGKHDYCLQTFFPLFTSYIYGLLDDLISVRISTGDVLQQFAADGVRYLELRTTPRRSAKFGRAEHVATVVDTVRNFNAGVGIAGVNVVGNMHVRLLLSLDRRDSAADARETLELAKKYSDVVVGIDLCGTPTVRKGAAIRFFDEYMREAHEAGLQLAVHFGEVRYDTTCNAKEALEKPGGGGVSAENAEEKENVDGVEGVLSQEDKEDEELRIMLGWNPKRLGHVVHVSERVKHMILQQGIGLTLEMCLSCNVHAKMVESYGGHHFLEWWKAGANLTLGTDDVGVFGSCLSQEYRLAAQYFGLSRDDVVRLARMGIDGIFGGEQEKARLRNIMWK